MSESRDQFDEALDNALASYSEATYREGLERRVVARVAARTARASKIRSLAVTMCTTTAAVCCLFWWQTQKAAVQAPSAQRIEFPPRKTEPRSMQVPAQSRSIILASAAKPKIRMKRLPEPKLPRFPKPLAIGSEERALLRLAMRDTKHIPSGLTRLGGPIKSLEITAIEIKPL